MRQSVQTQTQTYEVEIESVGIPGTELRVLRTGFATWATGGWMWGGSDERESVATNPAIGGLAAQDAGDAQTSERRAAQVVEVIKEGAVAISMLGTL